jgi:hypothetical protein
MASASSPRPWKPLASSSKANHPKLLKKQQEKTFHLLIRTLASSSARNISLCS